MKFLSFSKAGVQTFGAVVGDGVVDLGARHGGLPDLRQAIRTDRLGELATEAAVANADFALGGHRLLADNPEPGEDHLHRRQLRQPKCRIQRRFGSAEVSERLHAQPANR